MITPVTVKGIAPANVLEVNQACNAVLLVMRRPAAVHHRRAKVRWFVWCQVGLHPRDIGLPNETTALVSVPAHPARRSEGEPLFVADELPLDPLPAHLRAVALAFYPVRVRRWRFEFFTDQAQDPDATAQAWAFPLRSLQTECGIFRAPHRAGG